MPRSEARGGGAANFAIGAILMMHFARQAARFFDHAEIIELHHDQKVDAPSGTAKTTAELMAGARKEPFIYPPTEKETIPGSRGARFENLAIHPCGCPAWWRTRRSSSAGWGRRSRSATTRRAESRSCPG